MGMSMHIYATKRSRFFGKMGMGIDVLALPQKATLVIHKGNYEYLNKTAN